MLTSKNFDSCSVGVELAGKLHAAMIRTSKMRGFDICDMAESTGNNWLL